jgi:glucosamine 6-phosphate synthetase-like amidotransferase/phosphosugar isomerase protein
MHTTCRLRLRLEPAYSYSAATRLRRGTDADQPRNLAKSVTVE